MEFYVIRRELLHAWWFFFRWVNTREWIDAKEHLVMIKFYLKYNEKQKKQMIQRCYVPML